MAYDGTRFVTNGSLAFVPMESNSRFCVSAGGESDRAGPPGAGALKRGDDLYAKGDFRQALVQHLSALEAEPESATCHFRVGLDYWHLMQPDLARHHLGEATRIEPENAKAHAALAQVLLIGSDPDAATAHARRAVELAPTDQDVAVVLASVLEGNRHSEEAWEIVEWLAGMGHRSIGFALLYARMAATADQAIEALGMVSELLTDPRPMLPPDRSVLHFAAAGLLDRMGRYDEAFEHASHANALRGVRYDPVVIERVTSDFLDYFTTEALRRQPRATHGSDLPVFVVGMPRSGTTLVEQILASHPAVHGAGELTWIARLWESAAARHPLPGAPFSHYLDAMTAADADELASMYLSPLRALRPDARRIVDKMPANFIHLGLIAILFPNARVIHCRRDPLDTCVSCYLTNFSGGHAFTSSLPSLGHFYRKTEQMMAHWKRVLDLPILEVGYEELVSDLEGVSRRMIEFIQLPWDEQCLRFYESRRFNATASNAQVRKPIYTNSIGRWRNYEKHLGPLRAALGE